MKPITTPTTKEEMLSVVRELDAAHYFASASEDADEIERANKRIVECERAIDAAAFDINEDGNVVPRHSDTAHVEGDKQGGGESKWGETA